MNPKSLTRKSKKLSWLLRHGAQKAHVPMDAAGWCDVPTVLRTLKMSAPELRVVVRDNNKSRLQWEGNKIRACQGHSTEGTPVTQDALEASWELYKGDEPVWHGTNLDAMLSILEEGIVPGARTHVHLADGLESRTGKRAGVAVMLQVSPQRMRARGLPLFVSPNGVILTRYVPPACIEDFKALSRRAKNDELEFRALLEEAQAS